MQIILLESVKKLGKVGDVVSVSNGYARNFLLPNKKAIRATEITIEEVKKNHSELEAKNKVAIANAESIKNKMGRMTVVVKSMTTETGQLYGSVTPSDIAKAINEKGYTVSSSQVYLTDVIKKIGEYPVKLDLHPEVQADIIVKVMNA